MIIKADETMSVAVLTANSANINYPVTNILHSSRTRVFKTVALTTTATIVFDCLTAVTCNSIDIDNHNISSGVTALKWQGNATDAWGAPSVDEDLTYSSGIINKDFTGGSYRYWRLHIEDAANTDTFIKLGRVFTGGSYRYWRLHIEDAANTDTFIKLGRVFGANSLTTSVIGGNISDSYQTDTVKTRTNAGVTYGDLRDNYQLISVNWNKITTATEKPLLKTMFDQVSISTPFFVTFDDSNISLNTVYVTIDGNGLHFVYYPDARYCKASISFIEEK